MSDTAFRFLSRIDRECRRSLGAPDAMGARYPRDYFRPYDALRRNRWTIDLYRDFLHSPNRHDS
jgi:hypothetical protein